MKKILPPLGLPVERKIKKNYQLGQFCANTGPFGVPGSPEEAQYQAKVCVNHGYSPVIPIGGNWDQIWTLRALQVPLGPSKGSLGAKTGPGVP